MRTNLLISAAVMLLSTFALGQRGPGGVSDDSNDQLNCRLWLDAGDLNFADQDDVTLWEDKSVSDIVDQAFWDSDQDFLPPIFRNDPSNGINGKPVISFEDGGMLSIGEYPDGDISEDLNSNPNKVTTYEQTIFVVFRTSNDVTSRQVLWEEGGSARGINIMIVGGNILIGVYDDIIDDENTPEPPGDLNLGIYGPVQKFGYTYKSLPVQPNTTYVVSLVFDAPTDNSRLTNSNIAGSSFTGLTGTLNGQPFPNLMTTGCCELDGVGGLYRHPDPIGIGGMNRTTYTENGPVELDDLPTGAFGFTGRLAEICYYAFDVSPCQRIIIENYLAAKYFANVIANDKYEYQTSFGDDVIGIGKENSSDFHNISQGLNLFEISVNDLLTTFNAPSPQYLLVGHNNTPLSWTSDNVPDTLSFQRLRRIWRFDRSGAIPVDKNVILKFEPSELPALPSGGFSKYGVVVDNSNGALPNFTGSNTDIIGLELTNGRYECEAQIEDGAFLSVVAIKPTVNFAFSTTSVIEGNVGDPSLFERIYMELNYSPPSSESFTITLDNVDGTALITDDYLWPSSNNDPIDFVGGLRERFLDIQIVNDDDAMGDDPIEEFYVVLNSATTGLNVGQNDTLTVRILDNDPPPKVTFESENASFNESDGTIKVPLEVIGTFPGSATASVGLKPGGTATQNVDYTWTAPQTLNFTPAIPRDSVVISVDNDLVDEVDETFFLEITSASGLGFDPSLISETEITLIDDDVPPTVSFLAASSEGYEGVGDPRIYVQLSAPSSKEIIIPFSQTGGTATNSAVTGTGSDYDAEINSTLIIPAGDTLSFIYYDIPTGETNFIVTSDGVDEPDESAIFELDPNPTNAQLGAITQHTYFIRDYVEFENRGVAGVGKDRDNTIVMVANEAVSTSNVPNLSPRNIEIVQNNSGRRPSLITDALNEKSVLRFDGNNDYLGIGDPSTEGQSSLVNTAGLYDGKSIFLVFTPRSVSASSGYQTLYEQGGGARGLSIYLKNNRLYFQGWNEPNDGDYSPWGDNSSNYALVQSSTTIQQGETYIISAHYVNNQLPTPPDNRGLKLYVNGVLEDTYSGTVGRLYTHGGRAALGCVWHQSYFDDGPLTGQGVNDPPERCFDGDIAEMIYFNEPNTNSSLRMNEPRIQIIHNHLSAKYNVPLNSDVQYFDISSNGDATSSNYFGNQVAGIAEIGTSVHGDSKGAAEIRVHTPTFTGGGDYYAVWGHDNGGFTNTWPISYWNASLPDPIEERSGRIWRFFTNAADGELTAKIEIDYSESDNADLIEPNEDQYLRLLVHKNASPEDFSSLQEIIEPQSSSLDGNTIIFEDVPIENGMYVSLGNTSSITNLPLPIELLSFGARMVGTYVNINWSTSSEINNDYFVVERAGEDLVWEPILTVDGAGNSNTLLTYREKDREPLKGVSYYRLKQVDFDGQYSYSETVSVFNGQVRDSEDVFMYPNPSKQGSVFLRIPFATRDYRTTATMFDMSGKQVYSELINTASDIHEFRYGSLTPGIYFIQISSEAISETKKLVVE